MKKLFLSHRLIIIGVAAAALLSCQYRNDHSKQKFFTDLGDDNRNVAQRFDDYVRKSEHCRFDSSADFRVIIAGFGPFSGKPVNTSGLVAMNFANQINQPEAALTDVAMTASDFDGLVRQDMTHIGGRKVAVCAIEASVIWDLACAIYVHEANLFKPNLIIMSGMDGTSDYVGTWEHYTTNFAKPWSGYEHDGQDSRVTPVPLPGSDAAEIVPGGPSRLPMRWNAPLLVERTNPVLQKNLRDFSVQTSPAENPGEYLCNNVSYVVLAALDGLNVPLAGGLMPIKASGLTSTKAGFFHYPWASPQDQAAVNTWSKVLAAAIEAELFGG